MSKSIRFGFFFVLAVFTAAYLYQNTFFSGDLGLLFYREWDDHAFHGILRGMHQDWARFHLLSSLSYASIGYGKLFWLLYAAVTFPFYLGGSEFGLAYVPRALSTLLAAGSVVLVVKGLLRLSKQKDLSYLVGLFLVATSSFPFAALRFHNIALVQFLSALSLYFVLQNSFRAVMTGWFVLGLAAGVKLNGLFLFPSVALLSCLSVRANFKNVVSAVIVFLGGFFLSLNPLIFFYPFCAGRVDAHFAEIGQHLKRVGATQAARSNFRDVYASGLIAFYFPIWVWVASAAVAMRTAMRSRRIEETTILFANGVVIFLYLLFRSPQGPPYAASYFYAVGFLALIPLATLPDTVVVKMFLLVGLGLQFLVNLPAIKEWTFLYQNRWRSPHFQELLTTRQTLRGILGPKPRTVTVCREPQTIFPWTMFDDGVDEQLLVTETLGEFCAKAKYLILSTPSKISPGPDDRVLFRNAKETVIERR